MFEILASLPFPMNVIVTVILAIAAIVISAELLMLLLKGRRR